MASVARRVLGALPKVAGQRRALSSASAAAPGAERVARFIAADDQEEYYGVLSVDETTARIAQRGAGGRLAITNESKPVDFILPPVDPPHVWCVGLNYASHAAEVGMTPPRHPLLFSKAVNCLIGHRSAIVVPSVAAGEADYEAELAVVIGRACKDVPPEEALSYVLGVTVANDVGARKWQGKKGGGQWDRAKSFDTFLPLGPHLVPLAALGKDIQNLSVRTLLNGELVQDGNTSEMVWPVKDLIAFASQGTTLLPGTVLLTGTPAGVGYVKNRYLKRGDSISITIEGVGTLVNDVAEEGEDGFVVAGRG